MSTSKIKPCHTLAWTEAIALLGVNRVAANLQNRGPQLSRFLETFDWAESCSGNVVQISFQYGTQ